MGSRFDQIYRRILLPKFFTQGWGKPENLRQIFAFRKIISDRELCMELVDKEHPVTVTKKVENGDYFLIEAQFKSPIVKYLPNMVPKESETAYFQMLLPKKWSGHLKPTCLHLAGTGDHGFWRRRMLLGKPLVQECGIASIILENPFYGLRKPPDQLRSSLRNVSDLFLMGCSLILESIVIFHWAERQGLGPLGITGVSMGGHMASLAACIWPKPIPLIPCLSWSTASAVYTQGVLSGAINWETLKRQYFSDKVFRDELFDMIHSPEGHFRVCHDGGEFSGNMQEFQKNNPYSDHIEAANEKKSNETITRSIFQRLNILDSFSSQTKPKSKGIVDKLKVNPDENKYHPISIRPSSSTHMQPVIFEPYFKVRDSLTWEALQFMRGIMDDCTHLGNFPVPVDPSLTIIVTAVNDAYMPRDSVIPLTELWPGSEQRTIKSGHISAFLFRQKMFRTAIVDAFRKYVEKYPTVESMHPSVDQITSLSSVKPGISDKISVN